MDAAQHDDLLELLNMWASLFGWTSGRINVGRILAPEGTRSKAARVCVHLV